MTETNDVRYYADLVLQLNEDFQSRQALEQFNKMLGTRPRPQTPAIPPENLARVA